MIKSKWEHIIYKNWILQVFLAIFVVMASKAITGMIYLLLVNDSSEVCRMLYLLYSCMADIFFIYVIMLCCNKQKVSLQTINKTALITCVQGIFYGFMLVLLVVMPMFLFLNVKVEINKSISIINIILFIIGFIIQGASEELLFRGYIQDTISEYKSKKFSIIIQSLIFTAVHILNIGSGIISIINLFLFATILGCLKLYLNNIFVVIGIHFIWNTFLVLIVDSKISGIMSPVYIFKLNIIGSPFFTGGESGIENSIFVTIIFIIVLVNVMKITSGYTLKENNKLEKTDKLKR